VTIPHLMNCPHSPDGWCLDCVKKYVEQAQQPLFAPKPPKDPMNGCTRDNHLGPIQQYTECCLHCGRNIYD